MTDRCLRCHRPQQTDREWCERVGDPGDCTGGEDCEWARDEYVRRLQAVERAARPWLAYLDASGWQYRDYDKSRTWIGVTTGAGTFEVTCGDMARLRAALRALDGDAT